MVLLVDVADSIATVTLNRPEARNALSTELVAAINRTIPELEARDDVSVVILTGADPAFCAGVDLKELSTRERAPGPPKKPNFWGFLPDHDKPVIGAVNGPT